MGSGKDLTFHATCDTPTPTAGLSLEAQLPCQHEGLGMGWQGLRVLQEQDREVARSSPPPAHHFSQGRDDLPQGGQRLVDVGPLLCKRRPGHQQIRLGPLLTLPHRSRPGSGRGQEQGGAREQPYLKACALGSRGVSPLTPGQVHQADFADLKWQMHQVLGLSPRFTGCLASQVMVSLGSGASGPTDLWEHPGTLLSCRAERCQAPPHQLQTLAQVALLPAVRHHPLLPMSETLMTTGTGTQLHCPLPYGHGSPSAS